MLPAKIRLIGLLLLLCLTAPALAQQQRHIYQPGKLKPVDSRIKVTVGQTAPDFTLSSISGKTVSLSQFRGKNHVLITFVPAAFTPVCSDQWPGYNLARPLFEKNGTVLLGITTDNIPSLYAWVQEMGGLWFEVLSDFWPHGKTAETYGVLRSSGTTERALILVDKKGVIRWIHVSDINVRPDLGQIVKAMEALE